MRNDPYTLDAKSTVATGEPQGCRDLIDKRVQVTGFGTASVDVQGSYDGSKWWTVATVTADADVDVPQPYHYIRLDTTAWSAGTLVGLLIGRDARTD